MDSILLIGEDPRLLETRAAVLAKTKASVTTCNARNFPACSDADAYRVVVLCHSLSEEARRAIPAQAHDRWPGTHVVQIASLRDDADALLLTADAVAPSAAPARLLSLVSGLLQQPLRQQ